MENLSNNNQLILHGTLKEPVDSSVRYVRRKQSWNVDEGRQVKWEDWFKTTKKQAVKSLYCFSHYICWDKLFSDPNRILEALLSG
jgi:hypothetical protein